MRSRSRLESFKYALEGIFYAVKTQKNLQIHFIFLLFVLLLGFFLKISAGEWLAVIIVSFLVICMEIINTAIECVVNLCSPNYNQLAKLAKDVAAAAVLLSAVCAVLIGLIIFLPKIIKIYGI